MLKSSRRASITFFRREDSPAPAFFFSFFKIYIIFACFSLCFSAAFSRRTWKGEAKKRSCFGIEYSYVGFILELVIFQTKIWSMAESETRSINLFAFYFLEDFRYYKKLLFFNLRELSKKTVISFRECNDFDELSTR